MKNMILNMCMSKIPFARVAHALVSPILFVQAMMGTLVLKQYSESRIKKQPNNIDKIIVLINEY